MAIHFFSPHRHSSESWNPGGVKEWQVLRDSALVGHPLNWHSRSAGMDYVNHWIPACAGMTEWRTGWQPAFPDYRAGLAGLVEV